MFTTQNVTKLKHLKYDKTKKLKCVKTQNMTKLKTQIAT